LNIMIAEIQKGINLRKMRVQWPLDINLLPALCTSLNYLEVPRDRPPLTVIHRPSLLIANPCVSSTTPRVHPHNMLKPKVVPQRHIHDLDRHCNELPAPNTDIRLVAAGSNIIVIRQIDIETQLLRDRLKRRRSPQCLPISRVRRIYRPNLKTRRHQAQYVTSQQFGIRKALITQVGIIGQGECEFAVREVVAGHRAVVQPLEQGAPGEQALVERAHDFWVRSSRAGTDIYR
jgi:hypothetical protein